MKSGTATKKIPGGKLVRVDITYDHEIQSLKITGDFFLHPEETLDLIIQNLIGSTLPLDHDKITNKIETILNQQEAQFIGVSAREIVEVLSEATQ